MSPATCFRAFLAAALFTVVLAAPGDSAEDAASEKPNFEYTTVTTKEGLTYRVPEDMPIENRNGIQAPIPFDEYMYGKFKQLNERMKAMDEKLDRIEKKLAELSQGQPKKVLAAGNGS